MKNKRERQISDRRRGFVPSSIRLLSVRIRFLSRFDLFGLNPLCLFVHEIVEIIEEIQNAFVSSEFVLPEEKKTLVHEIELFGQNDVPFSTVAKFLQDGELLPVLPEIDRSAIWQIIGVSNVNESQIG